VSQIGSKRAAYLAVLVAALGYFVDIYDLILFSVIRVKSLTDLGITGEALTTQGARLLNMQLKGMVVGGILWGILGDKRGRLSVLFGSILMYSLANIANAHVTTVEQYAWLRFIAGIGLAGELGAGVTLVAELLSVERRGYGTMIVAGVGLCGGIAAGLFGDMLPWRTAFYVGGGMGIALLLLRLGVYESGMFDKVKADVGLSRGNFLHFFASWDRLRRYGAVILTGVPIWFVFGILITFSPELGTAMGLATPPSAGRAVLWGYVGLAVGDIASGTLSQVWRSRRRVIAAFLVLTAGAVGLYFGVGGRSHDAFYATCVILGFTSGYWAVFVTAASEQFGTNLRATATTTVPNFVRGSAWILISAFNAAKGSVGAVNASLIVGGVTFALALASVWALTETFGKNLDYVER
jgi:predicted MFS family arabinose efflux permease